jgi:hypothetical protein
VHYPRKKKKKRIRKEEKHMHRQRLLQKRILEMSN